MEKDVTSAEVSTPRDEKRLAKEALLIAGSILLGSFIIAGSVLTLGNGGVGTAALQGDVPTAETGDSLGAAPAATNVDVSMDDDAVLGDKSKAKVAIVEFTDFECPFCKRFHADTFDPLVKEYVDSGKAVIVTRDFPLSFHDPKATEAAALAECVRKEKGDSAYFAFTKAYYQNTVANGKGLAAGKADELIRAAGANPKTVTTCSTTDAVKQEIAKDMADGTKAGVSGTPSFVIGTIGKDGMVRGERVVGALALDGFKAKVDQYLAK